jgi:nucleoside-diphosphate-sugar epimerase
VQYDVNVVGTGNLLEAAAKAGVKSFVFTSSARWVVKNYTLHLHKVSFSG